MNHDEEDLEHSFDAQNAAAEGGERKARTTVKGILQAIASKQNEIGQRMIVPDEEKPKPCKSSWIIRFLTKIINILGYNLFRRQFIAFESN
jgi:hypothetical protein